MAGVHATPGRVQALRTQLGLDRPAALQYVDWLAGVLRGDLGVSVLTGRDIREQVAVRAGITIPLVLMGLAVAMAVGLPLGFPSL